MQFAHIKLSNWKNFTTVDVPLKTRMFLIGPNASGKSNLLDVFRFLRDIAKQRGGGLQTAVEERGGVSILRCLAARRYTNISIEVNVINSFSNQEMPLWKYRIDFGQDNQRKPIVKKEQVWKNGTEILTRPDHNDQKDPQRLRQTHLEQLQANQNFRELAHFFETVQYFHLVPHIIRDPERFKKQSDDPFGSDFLERLAGSNERTRKSRLKKMEKALRVVVPQLKEIQWMRDNRGVSHLKALYIHWRPKGAWQDEKLFSDGTLRFLGFLWSLLEGQGPLLLEEPELSLHSGIVRRLARVIHQIQKIKDSRQVFVSTHSYDLISDRGIDGREILVLEPNAEGTKVTVGSAIEQIRVLLDSGMNVADAVMPYTEPQGAEQLEFPFWINANAR